MQRNLILLLILVSALFIASCGGGGTKIQPPGGNPNPGGTPPPATSDSLSITGLISYTGLLQSAEGVSRESSAMPIANAGVAVLNGASAIAATATTDTGWFEIVAESVPASAELKLKVELRVGEESRLYAELPFTPEKGKAGSVNLSLSAYDANGDGEPDGFRLQGGFNGGRFKDGVFGPNGLDMPFGGNGPFFGWLNAGDRFFNDTNGFRAGWSDDFDAEGGSELPPGMSPPNGGGGFYDNRIEVRGKVVEIDAENLTYFAEGARLIFIFGLVFEEHGTFGVKVNERTEFRGIEGFREIELGMRTHAIGRRLVDDVLQANRVRAGEQEGPGEGFFAMDGVIKGVRFDPRETWPPLGAWVNLEGVLITFGPDDRFPDYEFGEFVVKVTPDTAMVGIEHMGELVPGMRSSFYGALNPEELVAMMCIASPGGIQPPPPPPPPPFGVSVYGEVVEINADKHLVGVLGYWDDIIYQEGFGGRPGWKDGREPSSDDNGWGRGDYPTGVMPPPPYPGDPTDPNGREPILIWVKIVRETMLFGVENFNEILIGDQIWSDMQIGPEGRVLRDSEGNPIAASFQVFRYVPPPPGISGLVQSVSILDAPDDGLVGILPYYGPSPLDGNGGGFLPPDDGGFWELVNVHVDAGTILEGVPELAAIEPGFDAYAEYRLNPEDGTVVYDEAGNPYAALLFVMPAPPPPPPPASIYGQVHEVNVFENMPQNNGVVKIVPFRYGYGGGGGGWIDPSYPPGGRQPMQVGPGDPTDPGMPYPEFVVVRVDQQTQLIGVESLREMASIDMPMEAMAMFRFDEAGNVVLDERGNPIADVMNVYPVSPPPPPSEYITMEGNVIEYVAGSHIVIGPYYPDGMGGIPEFRFEITPMTKIESESGITENDHVFIEGEGSYRPDGQLAFFARFIMEFEIIPM